MHRTISWLKSRNFEMSTKEKDSAGLTWKTNLNSPKLIVARFLRKKEIDFLSTTNILKIFPITGKLEISCSSGYKVYPFQ